MDILTDINGFGTNKLNSSAKRSFNVAAATETAAIVPCGLQRYHAATTGTAHSAWSACAL